MDLNLIVLCGRLAVPPEIKVFESGTRLIRYLVTVRSEAPRRRVDVIPVSMWDPPRGPDRERPGEPVVESGYVARCSADSGRHLTEAEPHRVVAEQVTIKDLEDLEPIQV